jgi:glycerophosphoryl diester phosphodiesterase
MLDERFVRPIAHRGLHDHARGIIENSRAAFVAAIAGGYGIECDLRAARCGTPMVFHDATLDRLTPRRGRVASFSGPALAAIAYASGDTILSLADLLALVGGRVPLLVEIKSEWRPLPAAFLDQIAAAAIAYRGPIALMSFDPTVVAALRERAPAVPRGIVSGIYRNDDAEGWWGNTLSAARQERLSHLLESRAAAPDFYAYHVAALPTPVTRFVREVLGMPLFTWTVRTAAERALTRSFADAPIFEGYKA